MQVKPPRSPTHGKAPANATVALSSGRRNVLGVLGGAGLKTSNFSKRLNPNTISGVSSPKTISESEVGLCEYRDCISGIIPRSLKT